MKQSLYTDDRAIELSHDDFADDPAVNKGKGKGGQKNSERKCKAKLREKNKKEHASSIKTVGNLDYLSGLCCQTVGWGVFDRKWFIESSIHDVSDSGYTTDLKLRGALKGY
jgi:phage protein D